MIIEKTGIQLKGSRILKGNTRRTISNIMGFLGLVILFSSLFYPFGSSEILNFNTMSNVGMWLLFLGGLIRPVRNKDSGIK